MDLGLLNAENYAIANPLPSSWLGKLDAPVAPFGFGPFTTPQAKLLLSQLAYTCSYWDNKTYNLSTYTVGRYSITSSILSSYGYLNPQFTTAHGNSSMTYSVAWTGRDGITDLVQFLSNTRVQDRLAYQLLIDNYNNLVANQTIQDTDDSSVVAGLLFVSHLIGAGTGPSKQSLQGTGAYQWRKFGSTNGDTYTYYNAGRYAISVLSQ